MQERKSALAYSKLITAMTVMGTIGLVRRRLPMDSAPLAFYRGIFGALTIGAILLCTGRKIERPDRKTLALLLLNGAFLGINWMLLFEAYNRTTIAAATLCYYLQPTIVLALSAVFLGERPGKKKLLCAGSALAGMVFVSGIGAQDASAVGVPGLLFGLGAAFFYALVVLVGQKLSHVEIYFRTAVQLFAAGLVMLPYLALTGSPGSVPGGSALLLLAVVCVVHTGLAYALYFGSMDALSAQTVSSLSYVDPVVALLLSALLLREPLGVRGLAGAVLILGSALIGEL